MRLSLTCNPKAVSRGRLAAWALLAALAAPGAARAQAPAAGAAESPADRLDRIERSLAEERARNDRLARELEILQRKQFDAAEAREAGAAVSAGPDATAVGPIGGSIPERANENLKRDLGARGSVYAKPFLARYGRGAYLGGYMDLEYVDPQDKDRSFLQHRFIPFIYADVTDRVKVAAEIEFEYGGPNAPQKDGEVKLEFAFIDVVFSDAFSFRAGNILMPVGKFNLIHDSPVNDLTDRPLVDRFVIPTTWSEAGAGAYGSLYFDEVKLDYEAYVVNGINGLNPSGATFASKVSVAKGLRDGRGSLKVDNNNSAAGVGRLALSPTLGVEVGGSLYGGRYDADIEANDWLTLWALDATIQFGRFARELQGLELQGELARADLNRGGVAIAAGVPGTLWGWYAQANYHFLPPGFRPPLVSLFGDECTFTAVLRLDYLRNELPGTANVDTQILTPGLNFRPTEDTVFKLEYQVNFEDWNSHKVKDNAFLASIATYF